ncbi:hypothetical protein C1646_774237 [Rhizophagus diaphanus]|nr:hypothetical protein C1646_774237 [Rhizophagus diaphanus] [Rhizophagus sp. MUCL 43196]
MNGILGFYPNSKQYIEPELLRIIVQNCRINDLISIQSGNQKLVNGLKLIESQQTTGLLAAYDDLGSEELRRSIVDLSNNLYEQLITYYNEVYGEKMDIEFSSMSNLISRGLQNDSYVVVQPIINQCGRIRVAAEIFGSALAPRYKKSSYILAKFTQDNESIELYSGMYLPVNDHRIRFYCQAEQDDDRSVNIELWKLNEFYEMSRDSIIPIHNIYSQFIPTNFTIRTNNNNNNSRRKVKTYMAVVPINRKFHL